MRTPITVTFSKTRPSAWLEAEIHARVERLKVLCGDIRTCRVVVDIPHRHHKRGNRFAIRIELSVPGEELAVTRDANLHSAAKDLDETNWSKRLDVEATQRDIRLVISDAFTAARRQLRDYAQLRRREVKRHEPPVGLSAGPRTARRVRAGRPTRAPAGQ